MKKIVFIALLGIATVACKQTNKQQQPAENTTETEVKDLHTAKNSLDWAGNYFGVLPCASCPGINTYVTLNDDGTYVKTTQYQDEKDGFDVEKGTFTWSKDKTSIAVGESLYRVGEGEIVSLDADGQEVEGELANDYILKKVIWESETPIEGLYKKLYTNDDKEEYTVIYNTNTKVPTVTISSENQPEVVLFQTEVWAKGGVYENKNIHFTSKTEKAELIVDGKKIALKEK